MSDLFGSKFARIGAGIFAAFTAITFLIPYDLLLNTMNVVLISMTFAVFYTYWRDAYSALRHDRRDRVTQLILGIVMLSLGNFMLRMISSGINVFGWESLRESTFVLFALLTTALGSLLHLTAPAIQEQGEIPKKNMWMIVASVGVGLFLAGLLTGLGIDTI